MPFCAYGRSISRVTLAPHPDPVALSQTMGVTSSQVPTTGRPPKTKSSKPKLKIRKIVTDDLNADARTKEFQALVRSLRSKAAHVASRVRKLKKRSCKPIGLTLCQQCGQVIICQPRATHIKAYCSPACRQAAKRKRDRFKAARMLSKMHKDEEPVQFWVVVHVISTDEPTASRYGAK